MVGFLYEYAKQEIHQFLCLVGHLSGKKEIKGDWRLSICLSGVMNEK
jgi:hypothetical protein